jgi:hypothetical protein
MMKKSTFKWGGKRRKGGMGIKRWNNVRKNFKKELRGRGRLAW